MNCKLVVNTDSGNCAKLNLDALLKALPCKCDKIEYINSRQNWHCNGNDTVVLCGGDGTLKNALDKCENCKIFFAPCGTLNETSQLPNVIDKVGKVNQQLFGYVCATGSFTEIGYFAKTNNKQKFKALAYAPLVLKQYKCHDFEAQIDVDGKKFDDNYTLLMVIKSKRCFGFDFNKMYDKNPKLYLLAVKSFGKNCLKNKIKMFGTFFRIFFGKLNRPTICNKFLMIPFDNAIITLKSPRDFCLDGEKQSFCEKLHFEMHTLKNPVTVVKSPYKKS